jgi:predicted PurR-regulated permease PerM
MASDWQRALVALTATVVTATIIALLYWARSIFIPLTLAILLAFVLSPVVARLQRRGMGRTLAVLTTVGLVMLVTVGIGWILTQQVAQLADTLPDRREAIKEKLVAAKSWLVGESGSRFGDLIDDVTSVIAPKSANPNAVVVESASPSLMTQVNGYLNPAAEFLGQAAFTFILAVFMLLKREDLRNRVIWLLGDGKVTTTTKAVDDASQRISRYLMSQLLVNTSFGVVIALGLFALGVQYSLVWGVIATLMRYVPYIGTWIGLIPPVLFSFATAPGWGQPIAVFSLFLVLEMVCNNVIEPKLYGQSMGLSEVAQLVAAAFWAFLWGPVGLILSGPLTVCLLVLGHHVRRFEFFVVLLGDKPALHPRVAFYQRLAARDQDEAAEVALKEAEESSPEAAFDTVIVPALCLARRDHQEGDLDAADLRFVVQAAREIAVQIAEAAEARPAKVSSDEARVRVLLCPARDEAEHVAAELLAQTLDPHRWEVKVTGDETLASELVELVEAFRPAVVVIATMPPGGLSHARYLMTRLRPRFPDMQLLVGRWGCEDNIPQTPVGESLKYADGVDKTISETRKRLLELHSRMDSEPETTCGAGVPPASCRPEARTTTVAGVCDPGLLSVAGVCDPGLLSVAGVCDPGPASQRPATEDTHQHDLG